MKQSTVLAFGAALFVPAVIAKPMVHPHLHKRDIVTVTVTEDVLEIVNVVITVYNGGAATSTSLSTTQTTRDGSQPSHDVKALNESKPALMKAAPLSPQTTSPSDDSTSSTHDSSVAQGDSVAKGNMSPNDWQKEQERKQQEKIDAQAKTNKEKTEANEKYAKAMAAQQQQEAVPAAQEKKVPEPQPVTNKQVEGDGGDDHNTKGGNGNGGGGGSSSGGGPSGGSCGSVGGKCIASDLTIYDDQGAGACGWTMDTETQDYFALSADTFGAFANSASGPSAYSDAADSVHRNRFCGRKAMISVDGKHFPAVLTDKCPGCDGWSIDVSKSLWKKLYPAEATAFTRKKSVEWWFTSPEKYHGP